VVGAAIADGLADPATEVGAAAAASGLPEPLHAASAGTARIPRTARVSGPRTVGRRPPVGFPLLATGPQATSGFPAAHGTSYTARPANGSSNQIVRPCFTPRRSGVASWGWVTSDGHASSDPTATVALSTP
jgi:hypothetical protein